MLTYVIYSCCFLHSSRGEKKLLNLASLTSATTPSPSTTTSDPQPRARTSQRRSTPSNRKSTTTKRSTSNSSAKNDINIITNAYDDALNKTTAVSVSTSSSFANSMVVRDARQEQMMSDVVGLSNCAPSSINTLPPPPLPSQHSSSLDGDSPIPSMILTTNPFPPGGGNTFQPPPPPPIPFDLRQGGERSETGGSVGEEVLEGMGFLERRYHHHPDFSVREQQSRGYNIQAVVLRNS